MDDPYDPPKQPIGSSLPRPGGGPLAIYRNAVIRALAEIPSMAS